MVEHSKHKMSSKSINYSGQQPITIKQWKIREGDFVSVGSVLFTYVPVKTTPDGNQAMELKFKSDTSGSVESIKAKTGEVLAPGSKVAVVVPCQHPVVMKNMCAECGADLQCEDNQGSASVAMLHSIPELRVSKEQAETIGKQDTELLLKHKKLVLLVDLDQTLIHTTNDDIPANIKDVYHFQLYGSNSPWYHTRFRPGTKGFLEKISKYYELHICTFGARLYAHTIARFLDPDGVYFANRILSRDECFNHHSKKANLRALFPCGDGMVCIIDDREDVWNYAPNLIHVKPYHFFRHTGDINAPPGLEKSEQDEKDGFDFTMLKNKENSQASLEEAQAAELVQRRDSMPCLTDDEDSSEKTPDEPPPSTLQKEEEKVEEDLSADLNLSDDEADAEGGAEENGGAVLPKSPPDSQDTEPQNTTETKSHAKGKSQVQELSPEASPIESSKMTNEDKHMEEKAPGNLSSPKVVQQMAGESSSTTDTEKPAKGVKSTDILLSTSDSKQSVESDCADGANASTCGESISAKGDTKDKSESVSEKKSVAGKEVNNGAVSAPTCSPSSERELDVEDGDDYLLYLQDILILIHKAFYSMMRKGDSSSAPDLRLLIPYVRKKVLKGVRLVFSGVVPNNVKLSSSKPYQVAVNLGATVQEKLVRKGPREELTTHLVATRPGTAKVNEALRSKRIKLVTLDWLWSCAERWERVDERLFPLRAETAVSRTPPAHCSSPDPEGERSRRLSFQESLNPLLTFSPDDIARMDEEVEDILMSDDPEDEEDGPPRGEPPPARPDTPVPPAPGDGDSSGGEDDEFDEDELGVSQGSGCGAVKRRRSDEDSSEDESPSVKFRRGEPLPSDDELGGDGNDSDGGPDLEEDWSMMGAELERELGGEE